MSFSGFSKSFTLPISLTRTRRLGSILRLRFLFTSVISFLSRFSDLALLFFLPNRLIVTCGAGEPFASHLISVEVPMMAFTSLGSMDHTAGAG